LNYCQLSLDIREVMLEADPTNFEAQRDLAVLYDTLGDVQMKLGDIRSALETYEQGLRTREQLTEADPGNLKELRGLSISYDRMGYAHLELGETQTALEYFQRYNVVCMELATGDPDNSEAERDLAFSFRNLGDIHLEIGLGGLTAFLSQPTYRASRDCYLEALTILERRTAVNPHDTQTLRDLSYVYLKLGEVCELLGESEPALDYYQKHLYCSEMLLSANPGDTIRQRDLSVILERIGNIHMQLGNAPLALECFQSSHEIAEALAENDPADAALQRDLSISHEKLGDAFTEILDYASATASYQASLEICDRLIAAGDDSVQSLQDRELILTKLGNVEQEAERAEESVADWETFISVRRNRSWLTRRIAHLARLGRFEEIPQTAAYLRDLDTGNSRNLYEASRGYALCVQAIASGSAESLTATQLSQRQDYIALALASLRESIDAGYDDFEQLQQDPDFAALRELPEFDELISTAESLTPME
jgi:tetratricopeptide (TPR) repeat protein